MLRSLLRMGGVVGGSLLLSLCWLIPSVQALSISPAIIDEQMNPGEARTVSVTVMNDETEPIRLYAALQKFLPLGRNGQQRFLSPNDTTGIPSWTFVSVPDTLLKPGEKRIIPIQLRVPLDAEQGGAYEAIFISTHPAVETGAQHIGVRSRVGVLVLLNVGSISKTELQLVDWYLQEPQPTSALRGSVQVTLQNTGRTHVNPKGELVIRNLFGRVVERVSLNPNTSRILPLSERTFEVSFGPPSRTDRTFGVLLDELTAFGFGRYTITLEGIEGLQTTPNSLRMSVWSWHLIALIFGLIAGLIIVLRLYRLRLIRSWQSRVS